MSAWYTRMIGPLPAGAWVAIVGGGLAGSAYLTRRSAAKGAALGTPTATADTSAGLSGGTTGVSSGGTVTLPDGSITYSDPTDDTNSRWELRATKALLARGYDALLIQQALGKFLLGFDLNPTEAMVVNVALGLTGPPPEGASPAVVTQLPSANVTPAPVVQTPPSPVPTTPPPASQTTPVITTAPPVLTGAARKRVYGTGTPAVVLAALPRVRQGSVTAPEGATFIGGQWADDVLVEGRYSLPDGTRKTVTV